MLSNPRPGDEVIHLASGFVGVLVSKSETLAKSQYVHPHEFYAVAVRSKDGEVRFFDMKTLALATG